MMSIFVFLVSLPLAVSSIGCALRLLDDTDKAVVARALTWRMLGVLGLMWWSEKGLMILAAFVAVVILQWFAFFLGRAFPQRR